MNRVVIEEAARRELHRAEIWFADISPELRDRFVQEVFELVEEIRRRPQMFQRLDSRVRRANLTAFPWYLIYTIRDTSISILAIAHAKRRPGYWQRRVRG